MFVLSLTLSVFIFVTITTAISWYTVLITHLLRTVYALFSLKNRVRKKSPKCADRRSQGDCVDRRRRRLKMSPANQRPANDHVTRRLSTRSRRLISLNLPIVRPLGGAVTRNNYFSLPPARFIVASVNRPQFTQTALQCISGRGGRMESVTPSFTSEIIMGGIKCSNLVPVRTQVG